MPVHHPLSYRFVAALAAPLFVGCAARGMPPLHCADGALPCADQVVAIHCEALTDGTVPPDVGEVRWMLDGAKVPQRGEPPVSLTSWCSGTLEVAGSASPSPLPIELYQGIEGGHLQVPGRDRIWFETPSEEPDAKRARFCVDEPLPSTLLQSMRCKPIAGGLPSLDADLHEEFARARRVSADEFGGYEGERMRAWCEADIDPSAPTTKATADRPAVTLQNGFDPKKPVRIDLFQDERGWIHLPNERRLCFKVK
ncbi:MAG: hypothetical protein U0414_02120 [Polyangiaceae bacterium]